MKEITGNIFDLNADVLCVTTNNQVRADGLAVMGAGVAKQFAQQFPRLASFFGEDVRYKDSRVFVAAFTDDPRKVVSFPTKYDWRDKSDLNLIIQSAHSLVKLTDFNEWSQVVMTRPGCGNGGLNWETQVKPAIQDILDDRFIIVTPGQTKMPFEKEDNTFYVSFTGHRPNKIFPFQTYDPKNYQLLVEFATTIVIPHYLVHYKNIHFISGMALGWDQAIAEAASLAGIPWTAAVPFKGQEGIWPHKSKVHYQYLLSQATNVVYLQEGAPTKEEASKYLNERNEWMVDNSDVLGALWDGTSGGTGNCVRYGVSVNKTIDQWWTLWEEFKLSKAIKGFKDEYSFLSNMHPCKITVQGIEFKCSESVYMALKSGKKEDFERFA